KNLVGPFNFQNSGRRPTSSLELPDQAEHVVIRATRHDHSIPDLDDVAEVQLGAFAGWLQYAFRARERPRVGPAANVLDDDSVDSDDHVLELALAVRERLEP